MCILVAAPMFAWRSAPAPKSQTRTDLPSEAITPHHHCRITAPQHCTLRRSAPIGSRYGKNSPWHPDLPGNYIGTPTPAAGSLRNPAPNADYSPPLGISCHPTQYHPGRLAITRETPWRPAPVPPATSSNCGTFAGQHRWGDAISSFPPPAPLL